jgi:ABC-type sugar transport system permease subunit
VPASARKSDARAGLALILPFFVFYALFVLYPLLTNLASSLTDANLAHRDFIGLANYLRLFQDPGFYHAVRNTLLFTVFSVGPLMGLGFLAALCVDGTGRALAAVRAALVFPYVLSMVSVAMIWLYLLDPGAGLFNKLLWAIGLPGSDWLFDERLALPCLVLVHVWKTVGYVMTIDLAALLGVPQSQYEAARVDGAGFLQRTRYITLPAIRPVSTFLLATLTIDCFKTFDLVRIMTYGGPVDATTTLTYQIYLRAFSEFKMGYASALSVVLLGMVLVMTLVNLRIGERIGTRRGDAGREA